MVTSGIIKSKVDNHKYKVLLPRYEDIEEGPGESDVSSYQMAVVCSHPGCEVDYVVGEAVFVCILDNDLSTPVIMGRLEGASTPSGVSGHTLSDLVVGSSATLPATTSIGDFGDDQYVSPEALANVAGLSYNAQLQFNDIRDSLITMLTAATDTMEKLLKI